MHRPDPRGVELVRGLCVVRLPSSVTMSVRRTAGPGLEAQCPAPDFSACGLGTLPRLQMAAGMAYALVWKRFSFLWLAGIRPSFDGYTARAVVHPE